MEVKGFLRIRPDWGHEKTIAVVRAQDSVYSR
jgi:hypothetical protein